MTKFTIDITDPDQLAGITAAREAHNDAIPATIKGGQDGKTDIPNPALIATDADYVQFVMDSAVDSYAQQHTDPIVVRDRQIVKLQAEKTALIADNEILKNKD